MQVYEGLSFSDGQPIALFRCVFPAERFSRMLEALQETPSVTAAYRAHGLMDYTRASTRVTAKPASPTQALHLKLVLGAPILHTVSVNVDAAGTPVEYGHTWFAGDRVTLSVGEDSLA